MRVSVIIPTYNSARTIQTTLASVLCQNLAPLEILALDDGSTDNTIAVLRSYIPHVTVIQQPNRGVAAARNSLVARAQGDLVAFLDHDDIWHPTYLEVQATLYKRFPEVVASFTGHVNFYGYGQYEWNENRCEVDRRTCVMDPVEFFRLYDTGPGRFGSASFLCVPKSVLKAIGDEPFLENASGADDNYFCRLLPLLGPVVYAPVPLVAYRITNEAQSRDQLKAFKLGVDVFQALEKRYRDSPELVLRREFSRAFASKRRQYAKTLLSAGRTSDARMELWCSLMNSFAPESIVRSLGLLGTTYLPASLQPRWPPLYREE